MKKLLFSSLAFLSLASVCYGSTSFAYGYKDPSRKDYYDELGQRQGYSKRQPYLNQTDHYDALGQRQGYSKQDQWSGEIRHYDSLGQYQGSTR